VFFAIAKPVFNKLTPEQQATLRAAAKEAAVLQVRNTLADEQTALAKFKQAGMIVSEPDLAPFRASASKLYADEGFEQKWQPGLKAKIDAVN
jgi:TRAP-type C4-dicarboxylate transport system substrate-binding protein